MHLQFESVAILSFFLFNYIYQVFTYQPLYRKLLRSNIQAIELQSEQAF